MTEILIKHTFNHSIVVIVVGAEIFKIISCELLTGCVRRHTLCINYRLKYSFVFSVHECATWYLIVREMMEDKMVNALSLSSSL